MKPIFLFFFGVASAAVILACLLSLGSTTAPASQQQFTYPAQQLSGGQRYVVGEPPEDLYPVSVSKAKEREASDKYNSLQRQLETGRVRQEREREFKKWAKEERELRRLLSEQRQEEDC
jgi:hypothetical protein